MRKNLIELVHNARMNALWHIVPNPSEYITDMLIANGVTIPVRCKDCKFFHDKGYCTKTTGLTRIKPDYYCSYGERKDNETD